MNPKKKKCQNTQFQQQEYLIIVMYVFIAHLKDILHCLPKYDISLLFVLSLRVSFSMILCLLLIDALQTTSSHMDKLGHHTL